VDCPLFERGGGRGLGFIYSVFVTFVLCNFFVKLLKGKEGMVFFFTFLFLFLEGGRG
jgi:hypothetical protein